MTPALFAAMRASARARRTLEGARAEHEAARVAFREASFAITKAADEDESVGRRIVRARARLNDARLAVATALDMLNDRNDELAVALFDEVGLSPSGADLPAELRTRLAVVPGGRR